LRFKKNAAAAAEPNGLKEITIGCIPPQLRKDVITSIVNFTKKDTV
jgi:hypothetical protein